MATYTVMCWADTGFIGSNQTSNYSSSSNFSLDSTGSGRWAAFHFNINGIPTGARINSAVVKITKYSGGTPTVYARRYTATWNAATVTPSTEPANVSDLDPGVAVGANGTYDVPATNIVKQWIENGAGNYGIRLHASSGSLTYFRSAESAAPKNELRATLVVDYTEVPNMQVNISDTWRQASGVYVNIGDVWRTVTTAYVNIGDTWRQL